MSLQELISATRFGNLCKVKSLVETGVDANAKDMFRSALTEASSQGYLEIVKYLVGAGADVNTFIDSGCTALSKASIRGHLEIVKYLIEHGADVNAKDNIDGFTALMKASEAGYLEIVKYLVGAGADVNIESFAGYTAQQHATAAGKTEVAEYLASLSK